METALNARRGTMALYLPIRAIGVDSKSVECSAKMQDMRD